MKEITTVRITIVKRNRTSLFHIRQEVPRAFQFMLTTKLIKRVASKNSFNSYRNFKSFPYAAFLEEHPS